MYRYLCLVWDRQDQQATEAARHITTAISAKNKSTTALSSHHSTNGFALYWYSDDSNPIILERDNGKAGTCIIFGTTFDKNCPTGKSIPVRSFDRPALDDIIDNHGKNIGRQYWGRYLFLIANPVSKITAVIPDVYGAIPCYYIHIDGVTIFFSNFRDLPHIAGFDRSIRTDYIKSLLTATPDESPNTGICGIWKIPHGYRLCLENADTRADFIWTPREYVDQARHASEDSAASALRDSILSAVHGHLSGHNKLLMRLSGGLDSNIVLAAARHVRPDIEILCVHSSFNDPAADEADLAELGARRANARFVKILYDCDTFSYSDLFEQPPSPERNESYYQKCIYDKVKLHYDEFGATAVFTGHGGDEIFLPPIGTYIAADFVRHHGLSTGLPSILLDSARHGSDSVFRTLLRAVQYGMFHKPEAKLYRSVLAGNSYIPGELFEGVDAELLAHGWLKQLPNLPPAKFVHTKIISHGARHYINYGSASYFNEIIPLYSQPIIETALAIPSYQLALNGRGRGLVRKAFEDIVPSAIVWRESKATGDKFMSRVVYSQRDFIRSALLDGWLVKHGYLNGKAIEMALDESTISLHDDNAHLLHFVEVEAWVQQWLTGT